MRLEWLEDILAVVETGSLSEAAERRRLTQSAFSRRIRSIEDYVDVEIFDRTCKPVKLHRSMEVHQAQIILLTGMLRQLVADLRRGARTAQNKLVISSQHALTTSLTSSIIQEMQLFDENIYVRLRSANLNECFAQLLAREADFAIVYKLLDEDHSINGTYIERTIIAHDELVPVIATEAKARICSNLEDGDVSYVAYPSDVFLGQVMEQKIYPRIRNALPTPKAETALTIASMEMASMGIGVAWVPETLARERLENGQLVNLKHLLPSCDLDVMVARLAGTSSSVEQAVWNWLQTYSKRQLGPDPNYC